MGALFNYCVNSTIHEKIVVDVNINCSSNKVDASGLYNYLGFTEVRSIVVRGDIVTNDSSGCIAPIATHLLESPKLFGILSHVVL